MELGKIDLDSKCEYIIVYKDKKDNTINTWTLGLSALRVNYKQMMDSGNIEFIGIYKKLSNSEILATLI